MYEFVSAVLFFLYRCRINYILAQFANKICFTNANTCFSFVSDLDPLRNELGLKSVSRLVDETQSRGHPEPVHYLRPNITDRV